MLDIRVCDWYLFEEHTILRIYGSEVKPYLLLAFLTLNMYALEFIILKFYFDYIHFSNTIQPSTSRLTKKIDPFLVKSRTTMSIMEYILKVLNL